MRSSKELLKASLLLTCSKNSNHRIGFQLTCTANSPLLLNMKRVVERQNFLHSIIAFQGASSCRLLIFNMIQDLMRFNMMKNVTLPTQIRRRNRVTEHYRTYWITYH